MTTSEKCKAFRVKFLDEDGVEVDMHTFNAFDDPQPSGYTRLKKPHVNRERVHVLVRNYHAQELQKRLRWASLVRSYVIEELQLTKGYHGYHESSLLVGTDSHHVFNPLDPCVPLLD